MKKALGALLAGVLMIAPMNAFASVKAGAVCKKAGSTATVNGKKFTCIKSGKKLVWNKGVAIAKPKPAVTPTPVATPTPTPEPTPTPQPSVSVAPTPARDLNRGYLRQDPFFVYRITNGVLERRIYESDSYTSVDSRPEREFDPIRVKAYGEITGIPRTVGHPRIEILYSITENYPKDHAEAIKLGVTFAAEKFSLLFDENIKTSVVLVTEKDKEFVRNNVGRLSRPDDVAGTLANLDRYVQNSIHVGSGSAGFNRRGTGFMGGTYVGTFPSYLGVEYLWPEIATHEMAHVLQMYYISKREFRSEEAWLRAAPVHFTEGSANTIGHALAVQNLGWYSDESDYTIKRYMSGFRGNNKMETEAEVLEMLERTISRSDPLYAEMAYPVGQVLWEFIIGTYGFDAYMKFLKNVSILPGYEENLKDVTGLSKLELYKSAAPYIISTWKRAVNLPNR
jgi:hypothetical protein